MSKRSPAPDVHVTEQAHMEAGALAVPEIPLIHGMSMLDAVEYSMGVTRWKQEVLSQAKCSPGGLISTSALGLYMRG